MSTLLDRTSSSVRENALVAPAPSDAATPATPTVAGPAPVKVDKRVKALRRFALSITVLNVLGHTVLGFEQAPIDPVICVLVAYAASLGLERLDAWASGRKPEYAGGRGAFVTFLLPAHITALACGMLLFASASIWPYVLAVLIAVSSKYLFRLRVNGRLRHFLNPSNFGIASVLLLFPQVGIAPPYQFTNSVAGPIDWLVPVGVLSLGTMLNAKLTGKVPLILGWVGGFVAQAAARAVLLDDSFLGALLPITGVAFILYTNYMITDPGTTPFPRRNQVVFGVSVAAVYGVLVSLGVVFGLFFALVLVCVFRGVVLAVAEQRRRRAASAAAVPR